MGMDTNVRIVIDAWLGFVEWWIAHCIGLDERIGRSEDCSCIFDNKQRRATSTFGRTGQILNHPPIQIPHPNSQCTMEAQ